MKEAPPDEPTTRTIVSATAIKPNTPGECRPLLTWVVDANTSLIIGGVVITPEGLEPKHE